MRIRRWISGVNRDGGRRVLGQAFLVFAGVSVAVSTTLPATAGEVNLYSYRQEFLIRPLLDAFTERTGIKVNVVFARVGMMERI